MSGVEEQLGIESVRRCWTYSLLLADNSLFSESCSLIIRVGNARKAAATRRFTGPAIVSVSAKLRFSLKNSLLAGNLAGDGCEQHCFASHDQGAEFAINISIPPEAQVGSPGQ